MMKAHPLIAAKVASADWCITPGAMRAIVNALNGEGDAGPVAFVKEEEDAAKGAEDVMIGGTVAVIPVHGIIGKRLSIMETACGGCDLNAVAAAIDEAEAMPEVTTVIFHFDSPGGTVTGVPELAAKIRRLAESKAVIGYTETLCASAAYWLACACDEFYAAPSALVGSIGVYNLLLDESARLEKEGVKVNAIVSGEFKLAGASFKALADAERAMFQSRVDKIGAAFRGFVKSRRGLSAEFMEGQVYDGAEAADIGMVDGVADDLAEVIEFVGQAQDYF